MQEIKQLLQIIKNLQEKYKPHGRKFSLDGKLVGDIGEVLCAEKYDLELYPSNFPIYDAYQNGTNKRVQIKSSFRNYCYFPFGEDKIPDYFLAVNILENGELEELYNGTGKFLFENYILKNKLKHYKENYYTLSKGILKKLNEQVPESDKIKSK